MHGVAVVHCQTEANEQGGSVVHRRKDTAQVRTDHQESKIKKDVQHFIAVLIITLLPFSQREPKSGSIPGC